MPARSVVSTNMRAGAVPAVPSGTVSPSARIGIVGCASETDGTAARPGPARRPAGRRGAGCGRLSARARRADGGARPPSAGVPSAAARPAPRRSRGCGADPPQRCGADHYGLRQRGLSAGDGLGAARRPGRRQHRHRRRRRLTSGADDRPLTSGAVSTDAPPRGRPGCCRDGDGTAAAAPPSRRPTRASGSRPSRRPSPSASVDGRNIRHRRPVADSPADRERRGRALAPQRDAIVADLDLVAFAQRRRASRSSCRSRARR